MAIQYSEQADEGSADGDLICAIAAQDQRALEVFYRRHARSVHAFVMRRLNMLHVADEVTNDTFVQVWRSAKSFAQRSSGKTWLLSIAKHRVMDAMRSHYRTTQHEQVTPDDAHQDIADAQPGPFEQAEMSQKASHLAACFDALSVDHRECIHLSFVEGMTLEEIAQIVDSPANTVGTRIHHAKQKLKACMEARLGVGEIV